MGTRQKGSLHEGAQAGDVVPASWAPLFERTSPGLVSVLKTIPRTSEWVATLPVVSHVWDYPAGTVCFYKRNYMPGTIAVTWWGILTTPTRIVRCVVPKFANQFLNPVHWGTDMRAQFVRGRSGGDWEFVFEADLGDWWQTPSGLTVAKNIQTVAARNAIRAAFKSLAARHGREGLAALAAVKSTGWFKSPSDSSLLTETAEKLDSPAAD